MNIISTATNKTVGINKIAIASAKSDSKNQTIKIENK